MGKTKLDKTNIFKISFYDFIVRTRIVQYDSFDVTIGIKIPFFKNFGYYWARYLEWAIKADEEVRQLNLIHNNASPHSTRVTQRRWSLRGRRFQTDEGLKKQP